MSFPHQTSDFDLDNGGRLLFDCMGVIDEGWWMVVQCHSGLSFSLADCSDNDPWQFKVVLDCDVDPLLRFRLQGSSQRCSLESISDHDTSSQSIPDHGPLLRSHGSGDVSSKLIPDSL